ncbi:MAG: metalloregulator ArsR/SmtB family transcription factor [Anaerolineae bacterium]|nr:metalloregulator ArsR/SmtB family transcription factor [Anaerolineae bacterium]
MDTLQQRDLLEMLKALADEQRLTMIGLLGAQERNVGDLAEALGLSEPTVSHHLSKLRKVGLVNLRMAGNQRFYRTATQTLNRFRRYVAEIEQPVEAAPPRTPDAWIEALDWDEEDKKVLRGYTEEGKLIQLPNKDKKWNVVLRWVATLFEPGVRYNEKEVNAILTPVNPDYAQLRRNLIDFGYMRRERGGGDYWLADDDD